MGANAGYNTLIQASDDAFVTFEAVQADNDSFSPSVAMLDITQFGNADIVRIPGLGDSPQSISGKYDVTDAGILLLRDSWLNRTTISLKFLPDGTNGYLIAGYIESFEISSAVDGTPEYSASFQSSGAVTVTTASV